jgi:hypothetical protein
MFDLDQQLTIHLQGLPVQFGKYYQEVDETPLVTPSITIRKIGGYIPQRIDLILCIRSPQGGDLILYGEEQSYMSRYKNGNLSLYPIEEVVDNSILNGNKIRLYIPKLRFALGTSRGYVCIYPYEYMFSYRQEDITYTSEYVEIKLQEYT